MSNYFQNFPKVNYRFGDETSSVEFQHLGTYVDILEQVKQYSVFYQAYDIQNGERPDQVSYKFYRDPNFGWTFFLLNDSLRQGGWPIRDADVYPKAQEYYPGTVIAVDGVSQPQAPNVVNGQVVWLPTQEQIPLCKSTNFVVGNYLYFPNTRVTGKILKVDQKMGMIWTDAKGLRTLDNVCSAISESESAKVTADSSYIPLEQLAVMSVEKIWDEFDAPHHYEDASGNWIYPSYSATYPHPFDFRSVNTVNSVSYFERLTDYNEAQKRILVIKPENIFVIAQEFRDLLRNS
jgi:hypothetical protein